MPILKKRVEFSSFDLPQITHDGGASPKVGFSSWRMPIRNTLRSEFKIQKRSLIQITFNQFNSKWQRHLPRNPERAPRRAAPLVVESARSPTPRTSTVC